jgi:hypothetical protein
LAAHLPFLSVVCCCEGGVRTLNILPPSPIWKFFCTKAGAADGLLGMLIPRPAGPPILKLSALLLAVGGAG